MKRVVVFSEFGQLVERKAEEMGISLPELAERCDVHYVTLRRGLEDPRGPYKPQVVHVLCRELGISARECEALLGWSPNEAYLTTAR